MRAAIIADCRNEDVKQADDDYYESEFRGAQLCVSKFEFLLEMCVDAYVEGEYEVEDEREEGDVEVYQR